MQFDLIPSLCSMLKKEAGGAASDVEVNGDETLAFNEVSHSIRQGEYLVRQDPHRQLTAWV